MALFLPTEVKLLIQPADRAEPLLEVDASMSEDHRFSGDVSELPIEDGSKKVDHVTILPIRLEFDLLFSDLAISKFNPLKSIEESADGRGRKAFEKLLGWQRGKRELIVTTGLASYTNMFIKNLDVPRSAADGRSITCRVVFAELPIVVRSGAGQQGTTKTVIAAVEHTAFGLIVLGDIS